jgi:hypothetical protein
MARARRKLLFVATVLAALTAALAMRGARRSDSTASRPERHARHASPATPIAPPEPRAHAATPEASAGRPAPRATLPALTDRIVTSESPDLEDGDAPFPTPEARDVWERTGRYWDQVTARATPCFGRLRSRGRFQVVVHFVRDDRGLWVPSRDPPELIRSDLAEDDDEAALACVEEAIAGSSWEPLPSQEGVTVHHAAKTWTLPLADEPR